MSTIRLFVAACGLVATAVPAVAGVDAYLQTAASHTSEAFASGFFAGTDASTALGSVSLGVADFAANYGVQSSLTFVARSTELEFAVGGFAFSNPASGVLCTYDYAGVVTIELPFDTFVEIGGDWAAVATQPLADASWRATISDAAGDTAATEVALETIGTSSFSGINLPAGEYTIRVDATGVSVPGAAPVTSELEGSLFLRFSAGFRGCSPADATFDDTINFADVQAYTAWFNRLDPRADLDASGQVNFADIQFFVGEFLSGCP